jgi:hypothetical protein
MGHFTEPRHSTQSFITGCAIILLSASLFGCGPAAEDPTATGEQTLAAGALTKSPISETTPAESESGPIPSFADVQPGGGL